MSKNLRLFLYPVFFLAGLVAGLLLLPDGGNETSRSVAASHVAPSVPHQNGGKPWDASLGAAPVFVDVTQASGVSFQHENGMQGKYQYLEIMGAGVGLIDYDGDGDLDIYFVNGNYLLADASPDITNRLYRNEGNWTFTDVTLEAGVGDAGYGQGCCVADYDRDGTMDLYVSNYGPNVMYRNNADGTFTDVAAESGVDDSGWGQTCSFLDYDNDGWPDLYVQNYLTLPPSAAEPTFIYIGKRKVIDYPSPLGFPGSPDRLYRNNGNGTFRDVTDESGIHRPGGKGMGVACADLNDDGRTDMFVANDTAENYLFFNKGDGVFEEAGLAAGVAYNRSGVPEASMGVDVGDYNRDGRLDMIVPCLQRQFFTLYRNMGGYFVDDSIAVGLAEATSNVTGFSVNFLDYDNDGNLDLFFSNGGVRMNETASPDDTYVARYGMPDLLLANDGRGHFVDLSSHVGTHFSEARIGRGTATGDLDNDGDVDLVVCNLADRAVLLRNDTSGGHWITMDVVAADGRRNPLGTSVRVEAGELRQRADIHGAVAYLSQSDRRLHFGLGKHARIDRLEVRWPDGTSQVLADVETDSFLIIQQP